MQHLEVSCAVRRFFKPLGVKGLNAVYHSNLEICNAKYGNVSKEFMNTKCSLSQEFREM